MFELEVVLNAGLLIVIIAISIVILEIMASLKLINREVARKLLHIIAGICLSISIYFVESREFLIIASILAAIVIYFAIQKNLLEQIEEKHRKSWGIFYFPVTFFTVLTLSYFVNVDSIFLGLVILTFADPSAALSGIYFGKKEFRLTSDKKTYLGSGIFTITATSILAGYFSTDLLFFYQSNLYMFILLTGSILALSVILAVTEAISSKGFDNFSVPVLAAFMTHYLFHEMNGENLERFLQGTLLAAFIGFISYELKFLKKDGAAGAFILGSVIFGSGGWKWALPILTFFILSSLLSKIRKRKNEEVDEKFEKGGNRNLGQLLANGVIPGVLMLIYTISPHELIYYLYIVSIATVCADTWATEIGTLRKTSTIGVLTFKPVEQGESGGISIFGTLGALAGSFTIAFSALYFIGNYQIFLFIAGIGFAGCFIDSIFGSTVQGIFNCKVCGITTEKREHCAQSTNLIRGKVLFNNDMVNFAAALSSTLLFYIIFIFFWTR